MNEDCLTGAKKIESGSVDLVICDPPFGISESSFHKHYNRDESNVVTGYTEAPEDYEKFSIDWIGEAKRCLSNSGSMYIISGWSKLYEILKAIKVNDLFIVNHCIWKFGFGVNTECKFVSSHYHVLYIKKTAKSKVKFNLNCRFSCGEKDDFGKSLLFRDLEDVWMINKEYKPGEVKNKNKLPEALIKKMVQYSSNPGDKVCDFFLGNFTTAIVSKKLSRIPLGFEINSESFNHFTKVLEETREGCELEPNKESGKPENQGKLFSSDEVNSILRDFTSLNKEMTKKQSIEKLCKIYKRGNFSILNLLKKNKID